MYLKNLFIELNAIWIEIHRTLLLKQKIFVTSWGRYNQHFRPPLLPKFCAHKIQSILWQIVFGKQRTNLANLAFLFDEKCWWNWMANFSPNAICTGYFLLGKNKLLKSIPDGIAQKFLGEYHKLMVFIKVITILLFFPPKQII
jgi:hypothetical protein